MLAQNNTPLDSSIKLQTLLGDGLQYDVELGAVSPISEELVDYYKQHYPTGFKEFPSATVSLLFCSQSAAAHPVRLELKLRKSGLGIRRDDQNREYVYLECADMMPCQPQERPAAAHSFRSYIRIHFTTDPRRIVDSIWVAGDDYSWTRLASCHISLPAEGGDA